MHAVWIVGLVAVILAVLGVFLHLQNTLLTKTHLVIEDESFQAPLRVVHLSDLHGATFGPQNSRLLEKVKEEAPDLIFFTGDLADRRDTSWEDAVQTLAKLQEIAPVYYVSGNHEYGREDREALFSAVAKAGICVLRHETQTVYCKGMRLDIAGLDEVGYGVLTPQFLSNFEKRPGYKILLSHFPENIHLYSAYDIDTVFSGHAHGGQFRFPLLGGIYSPGQGLFPKYYQGLYQVQDTKLVVSRGLGNSRFPFRLFNYPDIVVVDFRPLA